jgi:mannose-binding lectin 2
MKTFRSLLSLLLATSTCEGELITAKSFGGPFTTLDHTGARTLTNYEVAGHAKVHNSFVRLTPDRQSKRGFVWGKAPLGTDDMSAVLQFRISGQGARFFGDGIALWFSQNRPSAHEHGTLHGAPEKFTGVGIVLDTFKNSESAHLHKDVTVMVNNGTRSVEHMQANAWGCDSAFRYHEKRADFSVANSSRMKVSYSKGRLEVAIDPRATGEWTPCTTVENLGLPDDWMQSAYLGISASTGGLADNHDVVGLSVYGSSADAETAAHDQETLLSAQPLEERHSEDEVALLKAQLRMLKEELEHKLEMVDDALRHSLGKLQTQENKAEERITLLESQVHARVAEHVESRTKSMTAQHERSVQESVKSVRMETQQNIRQLSELHAVSSKGWQTPFALFLVAFGGAGVYGRKQYTDLRKSHLL